MSGLSSARSWLFVPGSRPERIAKALGSGADAVIVDLEDAVAPSEKASARDSLARAFVGLSASERDMLVVRINAYGSLWYAEDLVLLRDGLPGLAGVMVPKAEVIDTLREASLAAGTTCALIPLIESVAGLDAANALVTAPQVLRLAFGNLDFQADLGLHCGPDEAELASVRLSLVMASRRAMKAAPIDGVTPDLQDSMRLQNDAARSRRGGFGGKLCIHPAQVAPVNTAFTPSTAEVAYAQQVIAALEAAGGGVVRLDGRMIDAPVIRLAQRTLAAAR